LDRGKHRLLISKTKTRNKTETGERTAWRLKHEQEKKQDLQRLCKRTKILVDTGAQQKSQGTGPTGGAENKTAQKTTNKRRQLTEI
jgi:hypothetical protein